MDTQEILAMEGKQNSLQSFGVTDYCVFAATVLLSTAIGLYYAFKGKSATPAVIETEEYLLGGRNMSVIPIGLSLIAGVISGITYFGTPTEIYLHGTEYIFCVIGFSFAGFFGSRMVLPVFHDLQLSSSYEYLKRRYDGQVQLLGSVLFSINLTLWLSIAMYISSLAVGQVTDVSVHIIAPIGGIVCIFYTCLGGFKAVVSADAIQIFLMVGAIFFIIIKGTIDVGGLGEVWRLNWESGRIEVPSFEVDPTIRHSMMSLTISSTIYIVNGGVFRQVMVQRFMSLPTLNLARRALWMFIIGGNMFIVICGYTGLLAYATYHDCDPLTTGLAKAKDQLLPLLAMRVLGGYPGMPGLFVAAVVCSTLSSLSAGLNSISAVVLEDFIKPHRRTPLSDRATRYILRGVVVIFGVISVALVFVVEQLGTVLQVWFTVSAISDGTSFGLFFGGLLFPCLNAKGVLWGGITGMSLCAAYVVAAQRALAVGGVTNPNKMTSVEGCDYSFPAPIATTVVNSTILATPSVFPLFRISYLYYIVLGGIVTLTCSVIISYATGGNDYKNMDPRYFSPVIRRWLPKRKAIITAPEEAELLEMKPMTQVD